MQRLALNIETAVNKHRLHLLPEPEVALGNLKDPAKIEEKIAEAKRKQLEMLALDANFARVVAVSFSVRELPEKPVKTWGTVRAATGDDTTDERTLLAWAWDQIAAWPALCTFNGAGFDIPFLLRRSLLLNVQVKRVDCHPYRVIDPAAEHLDVCKLLQNYDTGNSNGYRKGLEFYAGLILGEQRPADMTPGKGEIGELWDAGQYDAIRAVCNWNAEMALRLAEAVSPVYA